MVRTGRPKGKGKAAFKGRGSRGPVTWNKKQTSRVGKGYRLKKDNPNYRYPEMVLGEYYTQLFLYFLQSNKGVHVFKPAKNEKVVFLDIDNKRIAINKNSWEQRWKKELIKKGFIKQKDSPEDNRIKLLIANKSEIIDIISDNFLKYFEKKVYKPVINEIEYIHKKYKKYYYYVKKYNALNKVIENLKNKEKTTDEETKKITEQNIGELLEKLEENQFASKKIRKYIEDLLLPLAAVGTDISKLNMFSYSEEKSFEKEFTKQFSLLTKFELSSIIDYIKDIVAKSHFKIYENCNFEYYFDLLCKLFFMEAKEKATLKMMIEQMKEYIKDDNPTNKNIDEIIKLLNFSKEINRRTFLSFFLFYYAIINTGRKWE